MENLNTKSIDTILFMYRYGNISFVINDGKIIAHETKESLAPASKRD